MELLAEILFEVYGELMFLIVPEKNRSHRYIWIARAIAILVFVGVIALFIWGVALITDRHNLWGIVPITIAALISLAQIVAGIVLYKRNH